MAPLTGTPQSWLALVEAPAVSSLEALVSRLRAKATASCGLKLPLVSDYGKGYAFMESGRLL